LPKPGGAATSVSRREPLRRTSSRSRRAKCSGGARGPARFISRRVASGAAIASRPAAYGTPPPPRRESAGERAGVARPPVMRPHAGERDRGVEMNAALDIRIRVRGRLSARLAGAFDGMRLVRRSGATELVGEVVDQTQLHGLLARIRDLGLELESVSVVDR